MDLNTFSKACFRQLNFLPLDLTSQRLNNLPPATGTHCSLFFQLDTSHGQLGRVTEAEQKGLFSNMSNGLIHQKLVGSDPSSTSQHTSDSRCQGHGEIKPELSWKLPLLFRLPGESSSIVLSGELCMLGSVGRNTTHWSNSGVTTLGTINHFLVGLEAHSEGRNTHLLL